MVARRILIDSNMLTLFIVGQVAESHIVRFKKTSHYSFKDYLILCSYIDNYTQVIITPNIATETSNLIGFLNGQYLKDARAFLANILSQWTEHYTTSSEAASSPIYSRLGLTDAAIHHFTDNTTEVLTDDFDLYRALLDKQVQVANFTHLRELD